MCCSSSLWALLHFLLPHHWLSLLHRGSPSEQRPFAPCRYLISPSEVADLHLISYEVERDLIPLILSNCQYSMEKGGETLQDFDLERIQQQVISKFLQGKPLITLTVGQAGAGQPGGHWEQFSRASHPWVSLLAGNPHPGVQT